jgi:hypothetical protein
MEELPLVAELSAYMDTHRRMLVSLTKRGVHSLYMLWLRSIVTGEVHKFLFLSREARAECCKFITPDIIGVLRANLSIIDDLSEHLPVYADTIIKTASDEYNRDTVQSILTLIQEARATKQSSGLRGDGRLP